MSKKVNKKRITELIKEKRVYFDGGMGTLMQSSGLQPDEPPESWNLKYPERITEMHRAYFEAGCNIVSVNTFVVSSNKQENYRELIEAAIKCGKEAAKDYEDAYVAYSFAPLGQLLEPLGSMKFEEAISIFSDNVRVADEAGADLIIIETMNDAYETKAAVIAAKENSDLPIFVTNVYDGSGKLMTGASPAAMVAMLEGLGVDAIGINCSLGPDKMLRIVEELVKYSSLPVIVNPNAGLPKVVNGKTVFDINKEEFVGYMEKIAHMGACILGGCCGTTPDYMKLLIEKTKDIEYRLPEKKDYTMVSSYTHAVVIGDDPVLIGERINPTGKSKLKEALRNNDLNYIINEGINQDEAGVHLLDVNVGLPEIDEPKMMQEVIKSLQAVTALPLQIDTSDPKALEAGMRVYNGKPLVNSVNGTEESMRAVFPIVKKYGGTLIALTIGKEGIPDTAEGRVRIALDIVERAKEYGIEKKDIIVDPLAMTISSNQNSARVALEAIGMLKEEGIKTSLGVSNISFGLPNRDVITSVFYASALERGLNCAIMNPFSAAMMDVYHAFRALNSFDENCVEYIEYAEKNPGTAQASAVSVSGAVNAGNSGTSVGKSASGMTSLAKKAGEEKGLKFEIVKGLKENCVKSAEKLLESHEPLAIINGWIVPALNEIGEAFEAKKAYLPQLLMSAEAASAAFEVIKKKLPAAETDNKKSIILATVKGDIHDIGKNIVKVLMESYGLFVIDLGRDVPPEDVCRAVVEYDCNYVGLSALMTTTVTSMEETIKELRKLDREVRVLVGGAVLTQEYADMIGADFYSEDAIGAVKFMETQMN